MSIQGMEVFKNLFLEEDAQQLASFLKENGFEAAVRKRREGVGKIYLGYLPEPDFQVFLSRRDFGKATELLERSVNFQLSDIQQDHYLFSFSREELIDVVKKPDEWSAQDLGIAKKILSEDGINIDEKTTQELRKKRNDELASPEKAGTTLLVVGYILSISMLGIFIGLLIVSSHKLLPDGRKVYAYDKNSRDHGKAIMGLSIVGICVFLRQLNIW